MDALREGLRGQQLVFLHPRGFLEEIVDAEDALLRGRGTQNKLLLVAMRRFA